MPRQRVGFLGLCGLKMGIDFAQFGLEIGYSFQENCGCGRTFLLLQFQMSKKEREIYNANSKWTVRSLFFFCCSKLLLLSRLIDVITIAFKYFFWQHIFWNLRIKVELAIRNQSKVSHSKEFSTFCSLPSSFPSSGTSSRY